MNEFEFIAQLRSLCQESPYALNLEDDAAILPFTEQQDLVISKDLLNESIHFFSTTTPEHVAARLLRTNLSDLAAMGAKPLGYFLGIATATHTTHAWLTRFTHALQKEIAHWGGALLGGDTTHADNPHLVLSLTTLGTVPKDRALRRCHAKPGDGIYVTGTIGDSYLALQMLQKTLPEEASLLSRYHTPTPRLEMAALLRDHMHAAIDISDGLVADLHHLCNASHCGAALSLPKIPLSPAATEILATTAHSVTDLITAGDDYELLFTAPEKSTPYIHTCAQDLQTPITQIGTITSEPTVIVYDHHQPVTLAHTGYQHLSEID